MKILNSLPSRNEILTVVVIAIIFIAITTVFVGLRPEHLLIVSIFLILFFAGKSTRKLAVGLLPFFIFGISYDWMRVYPNYEVNPIDVRNLYDLEKFLFGIEENGTLLIPCEYFALHHSVIADILAGFFYLSWVPVPIAFGLWLYLKKDRRLYLRFSIVFLLVNLIGFAGYYIHPAAPPWYAINYGFEAILNTPLGRFDELVGLPIFDSLYSRNSNVFAAIPSLHAAYMVVAFYYALVKKCHPAIITIFAVLMCGIWFTAVYSSHHYIIDVLLGITCALLGILFFEKGLMKIPGFIKFFNRYQHYIEA